MSEDDLIRRGDAIEALCGRMEREEYGHAKAAVSLDIEEIRALPADPRAAAAEELAQELSSGADEVGSRWQPFAIPTNKSVALLMRWRSLAQPEPSREYEKTTDPETGETLYVRPTAQPEPAPERCPTCGGSGLGEEWDHERLDDAGRPTLKPCPECGGA